MENEYGKKVWVFPDGELPPEGKFALKGHESIIILNATEREAQVSMSLYFADREPIEGLPLKVNAKRVRCIRTDNAEDMCGVSIPRETQYSICLKSDTPVAVQYGRLDTREQPMAFYTSSGYCE